MKSKQTNLRLLMKLEREKKKAQSASILSDDTPLSSPSSRKALGLASSNQKPPQPKGILKNKSSYQPSSSSSDHAKEGTKNTNNNNTGSLSVLMGGYDESDSDNPDANDDNGSIRNDSSCSQPTKHKSLKRKRAVGLGQSPPPSLTTMATAATTTMVKAAVKIHPSESKQGSDSRPLHQFSHAERPKDNGTGHPPVEKEDPAVEKELEELLNCSDGEEKEGTGDEREDDGHKVEPFIPSDRTGYSTTLPENEPSSPSLSSGRNDAPSMVDTKDVNSGSVPFSPVVENTDDVEQVAYEARLARLILMRKKQRPKSDQGDGTDTISERERRTVSSSGSSEERVTPLDYVPALAFQDGSKKAKKKKKARSGNKSSASRSGGSNQKSTSVPLSVILREKRAKERLMSRSNNNCDDPEDDEYDAYWK